MNTNEDDERDGLDIQSLSVVEAEFFFNKTDEGKSAADLAATKRTINLDAFYLITPLLLQVTYITFSLIFTSSNLFFAFQGCSITE